MRKLNGRGRTLLFGIICSLVAGHHQASAQSSVLPAGWADGDIGGPIISGSATVTGDTFTVRAAGIDLGGSSDQGHFVYQPLSGDTDVQVRVSAVQNVDPGAKAGIMIRESLSDGARDAFVFASASQGVGFQRRTKANRATTETDGPMQAAPVWLRLTRRGNTFTAYSSADGTAWTSVGSATVSMNANAFVGLAVTSHVANIAATASFTNVSLGGSAAAVQLPSPWVSGDIGSPTLAGSTTNSNGAFTVKGAGIDIWDTSDQFQFVYQPITGDTQIVAYVSSLQGPWAYSKAGVMIRAALTGPSANAYMRLMPANGWRFNRRLVSGGTTIGSGPPEAPASAPGWVRLVREGNLFTGYQSKDGSTWTLIGSETISMPSTVYVGLAVTANNPGALATATLSNVAVTTPTASNKPPTVSISSPASGTSYTSPANIAITATAGDVDGSIARVDVYAGTQLVGTDASSPYSVTWSGVAAGSYSLTAVATDDDGAQTTSQAVPVTVAAPANKPPTVALTAPAAGTSYTTPASVTVTASASDPDGSIARVEFYAGTQLIGTDTTSPYSATWSGAAAGSYSLTAIATDNLGVKTTSAAVAITVKAPAPIPSTLVFAPGADYSTNVTSFTVELRRASDAATVTPIASRNIGKPAIVSGVITIDISTLVDPLAAGSYYAVVVTTGAGGSTPSAPSPSFTK